MAKFILDWDEWYPVYSLHKSDDHKWGEYDYDISPALYERYLAATAEFEEVQNILDNMRRDRKNAANS